MTLSRVAACFRETAAFIFLALAFLALNSICQYYSAGLGINLQLETQQSDYATIFWRASDEPYELERSWTGPIGTTPLTTIDITAPIATSIDYIRIDTGNRPGRMVIRSASISTGGDYSFDLVASLQETPATLTNHLVMERREDGLVLESTGNDPFFEILVPLEAHRIFYFDRVIPALLLFCLLLFLLINLRFLRGPKNAGTLKISLPNHNTLQLPDSQGQLFRFAPRVFRNPGEHITTYSIEVSGIEPRAVAPLLDAVKRLNISADLRFHYRRPGEV